jgi:hypothetical protein
MHGSVGSTNGGGVVGAVLDGAVVVVGVGVKVVLGGGGCTWLRGTQV